MLKLIKIIVFLLFVQVSFAQSPFLTLMADDGIVYEDETLAYIARVEADGGIIINQAYLNSFILDAKTNGYYDSLLCAVDANWGVKKDANNKIIKIYDLCGDRDYAQPDTSKSPTLNIYSGGYYGLKFDGVDDLLSILLTGSFSAQPFSAYIVCSNQAVNSGKIFVENSNGGRLVFGSLSAGVFSIYNGAVLNDTSAFTIGTNFIYTGVFNGANSQIYKNNTLKMVGNAGSDGWGQSVLDNTYYLGYTGGNWTNIIIDGFIVKKGIGNINNINTTLNQKYKFY